MSSDYPYSLRSVRADGVNFIVTGLPAPLIGGPFPTRLWPNWTLLAREGFSQIVCLTSTEPGTRYRPDAGNFTWLVKVSLDSPSEIEASLARRRALDEVVGIARQVLSVLWSGQGVFVHCEHGVERTSLMIGAILVLNGADPEETTRRLCIANCEVGAVSSQLATDLRSILWGIALSC